jgi:hypothetical protein
MSYYIHKYRDEDFNVWDPYLADCHNSTWLHSRKFLSYHRKRFADESLIVFNNKKLVGVFPAAVSLSDSGTIVSHPGSTFGGLLTKSLFGSDVMLAFEMIVDHYRRAGFRFIEYKSTPFFYHKRAFIDDIYALQVMGAKRFRCDLTSLIDLSTPNLLSSRRKRSLKNANSSDLTIVYPKSCNELWNVLSANLHKKHGALPVHSTEEISTLIQLFPNNIKTMAVNYKENLIAGLVLFLSHNVVHAQYIASSDVGYELSALDLLFDHAINLYRQQGFKWFDFGISTEQMGMKLNTGLYQFKMEFGSGSALHEFYRLEI